MVCVVCWLGVLVMHALVCCGGVWCEAGWSSWRGWVAGERACMLWGLS